jgi:hypothetical protein
MKNAIALITAATLCSACPVLADPTIGFGLNLTFGAGQPDVGLGLRVFSDDREDEFAGSVGVDYMFRSQSWRGSVGAAYMMDNSYIELNGGYNFSSGSFDFGIGAGGAKTTNGNSGQMQDNSSSGECGGDTIAPGTAGCV